jgi:hypothetical protein
VAYGPIHATPKWDTTLNIATVFAGGDQMGQPAGADQMRQPKSDKVFVYPGAGSTALGLPTIGPFVASIEAIRETAMAPARCPRVLDENAESSATSGRALLRNRHIGGAAGNDAGH